MGHKACRHQAKASKWPFRAESPMKELLLPLQCVSAKGAPLRLGALGNVVKGIPTFHISREVHIWGHPCYTQREFIPSKSFSLLMGSWELF